MEIGDICFFYQKNHIVFSPGMICLDHVKEKKYKIYLY